MELYYDHTSFESSDAPWNGWEKQQYGQTLVVTCDAAGCFAAFSNFRGSLQGEVLGKTLSGLTPTHEYRVSLRARRNRQSEQTPALSFALDGVPLEHSHTVIEPYWRTLCWYFRATAPSHRLTLIAHDQPSDGDDGADFSFDDIWIRPLVSSENFDGQPNQLIGPGQSLQLPTLTITPTSGPADIRTGIVTTRPIPGMREGPAIVLQRSPSQQVRQRVRLDLGVPCESLKFFWTMPYGVGDIKYFNAQDQLLKSKTYSSGHATAHEVDYHAPVENNIAWLELNSGFESYLDFFTFSQVPRQDRPPLFVDHSDFEPRPQSDPWNGWRKGSNGQALVLTDDQPDNFARFENFHGNLLGVVLGKYIQRLVPGTDYSLSMRVRRAGQSSKTPTLSFDLDHTPVEGSFAVTDSQWHRLFWRFTATQETHRLELIARDDTGNGNDQGADFCFDDIRIQPAVAFETFDDVELKLIEAGQTLTLPTLCFTLLPGSGGNAGTIERTSNEVPGMMEGGALVLYAPGAPDRTPQRVHIDLLGSYSGIRFAWTWHDLPGYVAFYDQHGVLLEERETVPAEDKHLWVEYRAPANRLVSRIEVHARKQSLLDFFTFTSE
ncbi:hypothetical protein SAMN05216487_2872 [Pseudomonas sp. UC 17F4]|nr:hypothetical protein SAMN05216487_2872 [Pseudomonas sp. UC 17F4]